MNYETAYKRYLEYFENSLNERISSLDDRSPRIIRDAMAYAVCGGGKRVRPVLCLSTTEMLGGEISCAKNFALAIEFIHSYSLVHDDLPSMDNDDYRRGKFSTHKKFGEAYGVLAGDALLNFAFETCLSGEFGERDAKAMRIIADFSGYRGMIAGQVLDIESEKLNEPDEKTLYDIYINKTSRLLTAPLLVASELCGGKYYSELEEFGKNLGILFQITDDFLDAEGDFNTIGKTPNKDEKENKFTSIKVFGKDGAKFRAKKHYEEARKVLEKIPGSEFLSVFLDKIYMRKS